MSSSGAVPTMRIHGYGFVTLVKRTLSGSGEPHIFPVDEIDTIEKLLLVSQRIFDTSVSPRIFTENNCPIPHTCWTDTLRGAGRSGQHFYLETYEQQYTKGINRSFQVQQAPLFHEEPPSVDIRPVILMDYPPGLFSTHPLPDDLIVESIPLDLRFGTLASNIKAFLYREFSPNADFTIGFEDATNHTFDAKMTLAESGVSNGVLMHCRLKLLGIPQNNSVLSLI